MRFPLKLNRSYWAKTLTKYLPSAEDPRPLCTGTTNEVEFSKAISTFKFGNTFKSTEKERFPLTILELKNLTFSPRPVILDVGASDGITSYDVMKAIPFEIYYLTDLNIEVKFQESGGNVSYYNEKGECILNVNEKFIAYSETRGAVFPFGAICDYLFSRTPKLSSEASSITLINPIVEKQKDKNIQIKKFNIMDTWKYEKADLIIAANILNRSYFTLSEIELALKKLVTALNPGGRIVIIDNRPKEMATIFLHTNDSFKIEKRINGGTEIENLVFNTLQNSNSTQS